MGSIRSIAPVSSRLGTTHALIPARRRDPGGHTSLLPYVRSLRTRREKKMTATAACCIFCTHFCYSTEQQPSLPSPTRNSRELGSSPGSLHQNASSHFRAAAPLSLIGHVSPTSERSVYGEVLFFLQIQGFSLHADEKRNMAALLSQLFLPISIKQPRGSTNQHQSPIMIDKKDIWCPPWRDRFFLSFERSRPFHLKTDDNRRNCLRRT